MSQLKVQIAYGNFCAQQRLLYKELKILGNFNSPKRVNALEELREALTHLFGQRFLSRTVK